MHTVPGAVEVDGSGLARFRVALHEEADRTLGPHGRLRAGDRPLVPERHGEHRAREDDRVAHGNDDQRVAGQIQSGTGANALGGVQRRGNLERGHRCALCRLISRQPSWAVLFTAS